LNLYPPILLIFFINLSQNLGSLENLDSLEKNNFFWSLLLETSVLECCQISFDHSIDNRPKLARKTALQINFTDAIRFSFEGHTKSGQNRIFHFIRLTRFTWGALVSCFLCNKRQTVVVFSMFNALFDIYRAHVGLEKSAGETPLSFTGKFWPIIDQINLKGKFEKYI
jgi:hypothetical protein